MKRNATLLAASVAAIAVAAPALSEHKERKAPKTVTLTSKLKGVNEVPEPGDPDGRGKAVIRLTESTGTVCHLITFKRIDGATAAHIHQAASGDAGPAVVTLFGSPATGHRSKGCTSSVDKGIIESIVDDPGPKNFYVNVHNTNFPDGAIRGQLRKGKR